MEFASAQGVTVPALGLGTYGMTGDACRRAVLEALDLGYRHLDTAQMYDNEAAIGEAIAASDVDRESVFVTTKILSENLAYDDLLDSFNDSLDRLDTDYVDLLLIHAPSDSVPLADSMEAMNELHADGEVRHLGVSNFSIPETQSAIELCETSLLTNQVKYHPYHHQPALLDFCREADLLLTAYTPLARGRVLDDDRLIEIGTRYGKSPAQVVLRWLIQQDAVITIPKAEQSAHLAADIDLFDFELTPAEMDAIFELG